MIKHAQYYYIFHFCFLLFSSLSGFAKSSDQPGENLPNKNTDSKIHIHINSEGQITKNQISKNQKAFHPFIPYIEIKLDYFEDTNWHFFISPILESSAIKEWEWGLNEMGASYTFSSIPLFIKAGWMTLPLGYMEKNDRIFLQDLSIYNSFVKDKEDIGALSEIYIWKKFIYLTGAYFGGWTYKTWDKFYKDPDEAPLILSLNSEGNFWSGFLSWFNTDLAFSSPLQAFGAGMEFYFSYKEIRASIQSELWHTLTEGQSEFSYYVFPKIKIHDFEVSLLLGDSIKASPDFQKTQVTSALYERVFQASYALKPNIFIIGEHFTTRQKKGPFVNSWWAIRLKMQWQWPK